MFFVVYEVIDSKNALRSILVNGLCFACVLLLTALILAITPNGLVSTVTGLKLHIQYVFSRSDKSVSLFIHYWLLAPLNFGFLVIFILAVVYYGKELFAKLRGAESFKIIAVVALHLLIAAGVVKFILYAGPTVYNATEFILPLSAYTLLNLLNGEYGKMSRIYSYSLLVTYSLGTLVFIRGLMLFIDNQVGEKTYRNAKKELEKIYTDHKNVYITDGLWSLNDNLDSVKLFRENNFAKNDIIVVQQAYHPFPEILKGKCTIIYDWSTNEKGSFLGIPLSMRPQGYSFVVCKVN